MQPFVVVVPERPSLAWELFGYLVRLLWEHRGRLAPFALAVTALAVTAVLHWWAWWSGLILAPAAVAPLVWLLIVQRRRPVGRSVIWWRIGLTVLGTVGLVWLALAAAFGPLAGPLPVLWLLVTLAAQVGWLVVRRRG
ncbi:membrane protein [Streptomyces sp. F-3]|nr:membrane protein [Streptomyces sp. F-3]